MFVKRDICQERRYFSGAAQKPIPVRRYFLLPNYRSSPGIRMWKVVSELFLQAGKNYPSFTCGCSRHPFGTSHMKQEGPKYWIELDKSISEVRACIIDVHDAPCT